MWSIVLWVAALALSARAEVRSSASLAAVFSEDGRLVAMENRLTGERMAMDNASQFAVSTEAAEITDRSVKRVAVRATADGVEATYEHPEFGIRVTYRLQPGHHFLEKRVLLRHRGSRPFALKRISLGRWTPAAPPIRFQHGQCLTFFLRLGKGSFFFGVRTPFEENTAGDVDLAYPVRMIFPAGSDYEAEPAYWGVCRLTGRYAPKAPRKIKESVLSEWPADLGESEAMLRMVRELAPPRGGITVVYNGYQGGLYLGDYGGSDGVLQARRDVAVLRLVRELLGPAMVQPAAPFFGAYLAAAKLTAEDQRLSGPEGRRKLLDWMSAQGLTPMHWASLKAVHGWLKPRLGPYCPNRPDWQAGKDANCAADPAYMEWFTQIVLNDIKTGFAGFVSDEPPPGLRYRLCCEKPGHAHLPGDVSYAYFYRRREMFRRFREVLGPRFELQGQRPHMDAGIWDGIYLNSVFTFLEDPGISADTTRLWSRMRRHYSFLPSYMDQILIQPGFEPVDYTMLSALAVSSNYLFIAPSSKEKLKAHTQAILKDNRVMAEGLSSFPEQDRRRVRFWLDWARQHHEYMDEVIDLADWPGSGKPDGYLRMKNGKGYAFLFNSADSPGTITIPVKPGARLTKVYPDGGDVPGPALLLAPRSATLVRID